MARTKKLSKAYQLDWNLINKETGEKLLAAVRFKSKKQACLIAAEVSLNSACSVIVEEVRMSVTGSTVKHTVVYESI